MSTSRRNFLRNSAVIAGLSVMSMPSLALAAEKKYPDAIRAIMTRRSVRAFTDEAVTDEQLTIILHAAMAAPSAYNEQPWEFIVVKDKNKIEAVSKLNKYASWAKNAPVGILTCVDNNKVKHQKGYGIIDVSIATQNILLAVHALGLGATWTGIYPNDEVVPKFVAEFNLPKNIIPLAYVPIGHPKSPLGGKDTFKQERIRYNTWA